MNKGLQYRDNLYNETICIRTDSSVVSIKIREDKEN